MEKTSIANKLGMIKDAPYDVNDDVNYLIKDMNKDEAIEIIKDFIHTIIVIKKDIFVGPVVMNVLLK